MSDVPKIVTIEDDPLPTIPRKLPPGILGVSVNNPPFSHQGRSAIEQKTVQSAWEPAYNPWQYGYNGTNQPYGQRTLLPPGVLAAVNGNWVFPTNWYYSVLDQSPATQVWQTATGQFVSANTPDYVSFVTFGFKVIVIDTAAHLYSAIMAWNIENAAAQAFNSGSVQQIDATNDVQLTFPLAPLQIINNATTNKNIIMPQSNLFGSIPPGYSIVFVNTTTATGLTLKDFAGNVHGTISSLTLPGHAGPANNNYYIVYQGFQTPSLTALNATGGALSFFGLGSSSSGTWTPNDQSGQSLVFSNVNATWTQIGNRVWADARFDYPVTANTATAVIGGLPFFVPNQTYAAQGNVSFTTISTLAYMAAGANSTNFAPFSNAGVQLTNNQMSAGQFVVSINYSLT